MMSRFGVDYSRVLVPAHISDPGAVHELRSVLMELWYEAYREMTTSESNILIVEMDGFEFAFDEQASTERTTVTESGNEARLVVTSGLSRPQPMRRDDSRLRGWIGRTESVFGARWDKGHFIAHSIGGRVDGCEMNVFLQSRRLNRGWSAAGRQYRAMERYCALNAGTFCFSRPIYADRTATPASLEFGYLDSSGRWQVEVFDNR